VGDERREAEGEVAAEREAEAVAEAEGGAAVKKGDNILS